jgi:hypothetical protein
MESVVMDLRYAARRLRARPTYALLAALTLALGVGGTAAVWGPVRGLLIEPLPYANEPRVSVFSSQGDWSEREVLYLEEDRCSMPSATTASRRSTSPGAVATSASAWLSASRRPVSWRRWWGAGAGSCCSAASWARSQCSGWRGCSPRSSTV